MRGPVRRPSSPSRTVGVLRGRPPSGKGLPVVDRGRVSRPRRHCIVLSVSVILAAALLVATPSLAHAATLRVTKSQDTNDGACDADCSLREAVIAANATAAADTIRLPAGGHVLSISGAGEDAAATGDLDILHPVTILGPADAAAVVEATGLGDRVFHVLGASGVIFIRINIEEGRPPVGENGGGILNASGSVTVDRSALRDNFANEADGGAIYSDGNLTVLDTTLVLNGADRGGGLANEGAAEIVGSRIQYLNGLEGAGIFNGSEADLVVRDTLIGWNVALDRGSAISNSGTLTLTSSTIRDNRAEGEGGALANDGSATLTNTTFSTNGWAISAPVGGILVGSTGSLSALNVTLADSSGQEISVAEQGEMTLKDSLLSNDTYDVCTGTVTSAGYNLSSDATCGLAGPGDQQEVDAGLGFLYENGGPTWTYALPAGSPAINAGSQCAALDQRGAPRSLGGRCDIGAYERVFCEGVLVNKVGTPQRDVLFGTSEPDGILLLGGNDEAVADAGADGICGGPGRDRIDGHLGRDRIAGGPGNDHLNGLLGRDYVSGGGGDDRLYGSWESDRLVGGRGSDVLDGGPARDGCDGGRGIDRSRYCEVNTRIP
jgi:CSLREA domain-containing protein